ncbi:MAG: hypothetical protein JO317_05060 [Verrucomicrobiae bacterium]|nr:hypothetical protein [Verrucomicrobiae bacterium]
MRILWIALGFWLRVFVLGLYRYLGLLQATSAVLPVLYRQPVLCRKPLLVGLAFHAISVAVVAAAVVWWVTR